MFPLKVSAISTHIIGCIFFLALPVIFIAAQSGFHNIEQLLISWQYWLFTGCYLFIYYLHTFLLIPKFFVKQKLALYILSLLLLFSGVFFFKPFDKLLAHSQQEPQNETRRLPPGNPPLNDLPPGEMERVPPQFDIVSIFLFTVVIALGMAIDTNKRWRQTEQRALQAEADKANAELSFLKAQINPHFLFNTLNNIYSLAIVKDENTPGSIMKLSNILRYITDEVTTDFVPLQSEINCLNDYIELQRMRLGKKVRLEYSVEGNTENKIIAPLLLMCFAENIFKHGLSNNEDTLLVIKLDATGDDKTILFCQNKIFSAERMTERTGIGISNAKKRLEHLYYGRHSLIITKDNGLFTVLLTLYQNKITE